MKSLALIGLTSLVANVQAHSVDSDNQGVDLSSFTLPELTTYVSSEEVKSNGQDAPAGLSTRATHIEHAVDFVKRTAPGIEFRVMDDSYVGSSGIGYVNMKQTHHGIDVDNGDFKVNVNTRDGSIFSFGDGFFHGKLPEASPVTKRNLKSPLEALKGAAKLLKLPLDASQATVTKKQGDEYVIEKTKGAVSSPKVGLRYLIIDPKTIAPVWRVETDVGNNWVVSFVDATDSNKVHAAFDYIVHASETVNVFPWNVTDPDTGDRAVLSDPWNIDASPFGWFSDGTTHYKTTRGNNGYAQSNPNDSVTSGKNAQSDLNEYRPTVNDGVYDFPLDLKKQPKTYTDASITQLFYTANKYHDVLYTLGFTEAAGNFQSNNNGKGGKGGDPVSLNVQDGAGTNNANFATPVDGQSPRMRMYIFDNTDPNRDGALDQGVVVHEYTHGLSNRLTGGASNDGCLSSTESGGMGEGWSDFFAVGVATKTTDSPKTVVQFGHYVNKGKTIRQYPYTTDLTVNPHKYSSINSNREVHAIGSVWTAILYETFWNLIEKHGNSDAEFPQYDSKGVPTSGRWLSLKLTLDGLALQPCRPNFLQARDAIIDADKALTGGDNKCELWKGFAKRGLGTDASRSFLIGTATDGFKVPDGC